MKNTYTNKLTVALLATSLSFLALSASAGKDDIHSRMSQQVYKLQQEIRIAEANKQQTEASKKDAAAAKVAECKRLEEQGKKC